MAKPSDSNGGRSKFFRQMLKAQYDAYMKIAVRKHGLSSDMLHAGADQLSDEELAAAVATLRDLAHLPPE